jgi:Response regulators consisting of a CheY-like receiver domain and a winged-helix DNA-binding domain
MAFQFAVSCGPHLRFTTFHFHAHALVESQYENLAFGSGADDFVHKMLGLRSLTKRIELVLRKKLIIRKRVEHLEIGKWKIHRTENSVSIDGRTTKLSPEEFEIFYFLAQNANRSLTRDHIAQIISGANLFQLSFSIDKCLAGLTVKLGRQWIVRKERTVFSLGQVDFSIVSHLPN